MPETRRASRYHRITATRPLKTALIPPPEGARGGAARYEREIDLASDSTHARVIRLVGTGKQVLELGCSTGYMTRVLRERGCRVVAVEMDAEAAHRAKPFCDRIVVGDIERLDLAHVLGKSRFDVVLAADFLEHLKDPLALLCSLKRLIADGGYVVSSLPNVAHGSVRLALLGGRFPSSETGLLDRTHLHFYTHQSMEALFEAAGFVIGRLERQTLPLNASEVPYDATEVSVDVLRTLSTDEDALTYQYVTVAYPVPGNLLELIRDRLRRAAAESAGLEISRQKLAADGDALRARAAELENQNQRLTSANEELSAELGARRQTLVARERASAVLSADLAATRSDAVHLRSLLLDAHDQLLRRDDQIAELQVRAGALGDLEPQLRERQASVASLREELALTKARMLGMQATRVWRIGKCYWWLEARLKGILGIE